MLNIREKKSYLNQILVELPKFFTFILSSTIMTNPSCAVNLVTRIRKCHISYYSITNSSLGKS